MPVADVLHLRWYHRSRDAPDPAARWVSAARAHLPEAIPRRFGDTEPLRGRADEGDDGQAFLRARAQTGDLFFLEARPPVYAGSLGSVRRRRSGPVTADSLYVDSGALADEATLARVSAFFVAVAEGRLFASASVERGATIERRRLVVPGPSSEPFLAAMGDWIGLPPQRPAWSWFGSYYAPRVSGLPGLRPAGKGLLLDEDGDAWVPEELRAHPEEFDPASRGARRRPRGSYRSTLALALGR